MYVQFLLCFEYLYRQNAQLSRKLSPLLYLASSKLHFYNFKDALSPE